MESELLCGNCMSGSSECTAIDEATYWYRCLECGSEWREP